MGSVTDRLIMDLAYSAGATCVIWSRDCGCSKVVTVQLCPSAITAKHTPQNSLFSHHAKFQWW